MSFSLLNLTLLSMYVIIQTCLISGDRPVTLSSNCLPAGEGVVPEQTDEVETSERWPAGGSSSREGTGECEKGDVTAVRVLRHCSAAPLNGLLSQRGQSWQWPELWACSLMMHTQRPHPLPPGLRTVLRRTAVFCFTIVSDVKQMYKCTAEHRHNVNTWKCINDESLIFITVLLTVTRSGLFSPFLTSITRLISQESTFVWLYKRFVCNLCEPNVNKSYWAEVMCSTNTKWTNVGLASLVACNSWHFNYHESHSWTLTLLQIW